ncbi:MAG: divergent PAP2 family protein [Spirochaetales bacterium]|nr:divergent PAP2 family protein [Spirochaetales bacterium]
MVVSEPGNVKIILDNPIFLSAIFSWFIAQFLKVIINILRYRTASARDILYRFFWKTGGMPSSHTAAVTSVATAVGFIEGFSSNLFVVTVVFALIVIRDSLGVRRAAGSQAKALNTMGKELQSKLKISFKMVKEISGHTVPEVFIGVILGFFIAVAFCNL